MMTLLLVLTFVFGVLRLLTWIKIFNTSLLGIFEAVLLLNKMNLISRVFLWFDKLFFYFSLCYQIWYWIFRH